MFDREKAKLFTEKYGDDAYRFAFVITLSKDKAALAVESAFRSLSSERDFDPDAPDKRKIFRAVYSSAKKYASGRPDRAAIEAEYGEKYEEFYETVSLPLKERAAEHLVLYENYTETEAENILKGKIND